MLRISIEPLSEAVKILDDHGYAKLKINSFSDPKVVAFFQQTTKRPIFGLFFWQCAKLIQVHWVRYKYLLFWRGLETLAGGKIDYDDPIFFEHELGQQNVPKESLREEFRSLGVNFIIFRRADRDKPNYFLMNSNTHKLVSSLSTFGLDPKDFNPKKKTLADTKRQQKRIERLGAVKAQFVTTKDKRFNDYFDDLIQCKVGRFNASKVKNTLASSSSKSFYKSLVGLNCSGISGRFFVLTLNEKFLAGAICLCNDTNFIYLLPAFKAEYSRFSPGNVCLMHLIEAVRQEKFSYFDFSVGDEVYKSRWAAVSAKVDLVFLPLTAGGVILTNFYTIFTSIRARLSSKKILRIVYLKLTKLKN